MVAVLAFAFALLAVAFASLAFAVCVTCVWFCVAGGNVEAEAFAPAQFFSTQCLERGTAF